MTRGTAEFSLKDVVDEQNANDDVDEETGEPNPKIKYGELMDDGDTVHEK